MGKRTYRTALLLSAAMGIFAAASQAQAQTPTDSFTSTFSESLIFNPATTTTTTVTTHSTQILGRLNGGAPVYDQTFGAPFSNPASQAGVTAARAAITTAGGPGVIIGAPVLTASSSNTVSSSITTYSLAGMQSVPNTVVTFGPAQITIGQLSTCNVSGLPSATRPTCQTLGGTAYDVGDDETNFNTFSNTQFTIDQTTSTTNTTTNVEQYTLTGIVRRVGSVHAISPQAAGDSADLFSARLRDASGRAGPWVSGYGWKGKRDAQGEIPGDRRSAEGLSGGAAFDLAPGLVGGVGFDAGRVRLHLPAVGERATIELTQFGAHAGWSGGEWFARGSGTFGYGNVETTTAPNDIAINASGSYDVRTASLSAEAGRDFSMGEWTVTPSVGGQWLRVRTDGFTETGNFALIAEANKASFAKGWAGIAAQREIGQATIGGYARLTVLDNDRAATAVRFAGINVDMTLDGPDLGATGGEAGIVGTMRLGPGVVAFASYDGRFRDNLTLHSGMAGVRVSF